MTKVLILYISYLSVTNLRLSAYLFCVVLLHTFAAEKRVTNF